MVMAGMVLDVQVMVVGRVHPVGLRECFLDFIGDGAVGVCADDWVPAESAAVLPRRTCHRPREPIRVALDVFRQIGLSTIAVPLAGGLPDADDVPVLKVAASGRAAPRRRDPTPFPESGDGARACASACSVPRMCAGALTTTGL